MDGGATEERKGKEGISVQAGPRRRRRGLARLVVARCSHGNTPSFSARCHRRPKALLRQRSAVAIRSRDATLDARAQGPSDEHSFAVASIRGLVLRSGEEREGHCAESLESHDDREAE